MNAPYDYIVGVREPTLSSGVGLFNQLLAQRLHIPYVMLDEYEFGLRDRPLFSLKFEELRPEQSSRLSDRLLRAQLPPSFGLFLHTLQLSDVERCLVQQARQVFCGNDYILRVLRGFGLGWKLVRAFAPSLIPQEFAALAHDDAVELFCFGMASKVDRHRFERLQRLLEQAAVPFRLLCSLAVHQTSDGSCIDRALAFFRGCYGSRFVFLGTLHDMGVAYFLRRAQVFVGFYAGGVRSNNTTFNAAIECGCSIISNFDEDSPWEHRASSSILNLDDATSAKLRAFLLTSPDSLRPHPQIRTAFSWEELIRRIVGEVEEPDARVA